MTTDQIKYFQNTLMTWQKDLYVAKKKSQKRLEEANNVWLGPTNEYYQIKTRYKDRLCEYFHDSLKTPEPIHWKDFWQDIQKTAMTFKLFKIPIEVKVNRIEFTVSAAEHWSQIIKAKEELDADNVSFVNIYD